MLRLVILVSMLVYFLFSLPCPVLVFTVLLSLPSRHVRLVSAAFPSCGGPRPAGPVTLPSLSGERSTLSCWICLPAVEILYLWTPHVSVFTDKADVLPLGYCFITYSYECSAGKAVKLLKLQLKVQNVCVCV